jgi:hypothetical protein
MKAIRKSYVVVVSLVLTVLIGWTVYAQKPSPSPAPKVAWEYKVVSETDKISLNDLGAQGWELVTVEMGGAQEVYYFKRMK